MHSNKISACFFLFFFVFIILADGKLRTDYYNRSCPKLEKIVWGGVVKAAKDNSRVPASLLRLHFHDCFVLGCEASVLLNGKLGEQNAGPNKKSLLGLNVIDNIKKAVESKCPQTVSCADILALAARDAVSLSFKKGWPVPLGRLDGKGSSLNGANKELPSPFDPLSIIIKKFNAKGLSLQDMVALSGAHTIGMAKCSSFKNRLYFKNSTKFVNRKALNKLRSICKSDGSTDEKIVPLDRQSPFTFDTKFYEDIKSKEAVLESDQTLGSDSRTVKLVNKYSDHSDEFFKDFRDAMLRMGNIGVILKGGDGEIRKMCGSKNN